MHFRILFFTDQLPCVWLTFIEPNNDIMSGSFNPSINEEEYDWGMKEPVSAPNSTLVFFKRNRASIQREGDIISFSMSDISFARCVADLTVGSTKHVLYSGNLLP